MQISRIFNIKTFINNSIPLAVNSLADGVHFSSDNIQNTLKAKELGLDVVCSTHCVEEIILSHKLGANAVTFSPIFKNKYTMQQKGIETLQEIINQKIPIKIFALGGIISNVQIELLSNLDIYGFSSIRYFLDKA